MSSEEVLIQTRKDKHHQLNGGKYPLPTHGYHSPISVILKMMENSSPKTTIQVEDLSTDPIFLVHGRVGALRRSGAITFIKLVDASGSIQLIASKNALSNYSDLHLLDIGDLVEIHGWPCLSKTGEKSLLIQTWQVLTKAIRPPPEKFLGIADPEIKYRQRYLDLMSNEESRARFQIRSLILRGIRKLMDGDSFIEVETSTLNSISSGANARPFITHHNALDTDLRLRIAPELYLKRLLVGGFDRVYEIGRAYRNEGIDTRHNPEFTIMESYQAYADFPQLMMFATQFIPNIEQYVENESRGTLAGEYFQKWKAERPFTLSEYRAIPMIQTVMNACGKADINIDNSIINPTRLVVCTGDTNNSRVSRIDIESMLYFLHKATTNNETIAILFEYVAEPFLTEDYRTADGKYSVPVFITEYPVEVCPLARCNDKNPLICDRFEMYVNSMELANGYQELNSADEQLVRFQEQLKTNSKDPMDIDLDYVKALQYGMPPAIGYGLGIDRIVMALTNTNSIKDVILFPTLKPLKT